MTPDGACRAAIEAQCENKVHCGLYGDLPTCVELMNLCPDFYFSTGSTRTVAGVFACLDALKNATCEEQAAGIYPSCLSPGAIADNQPCEYSSQCVSGECGTPTAGSCSICEHAAGPGEACDMNFCAPGYYCTPDGLTCVPNPTAPPAAEGQPCNITGAAFVSCQGDLGCGPTAASSTPVCHTLPGDGQSCPDGLCVPPLICHLPTANNPICSDGRGCLPSCDAMSHCVESDGGSNCVPYKQRGEPCDQMDALCVPGFICKSGACAPQPQLGEACDTGDCPNVLACTNGVCSLRAPLPCQ